MPAVRLLPTLGSLTLALVAAEAAAQTDYYNLDAGRPLRTEDAQVIERRAFEVQLAPFVIRGAGGVARSLAIEPELAWGILPRTQVDVSVNIERRLTGSPAMGLAGFHLGVLHALNTETLTWPGLAVGLRSRIPAGPHEGDESMGSVLLAGTRTLGAGRLHLNAERSFGSSPGSGLAETRWRAGLAADRTLAVRAMLLGAELTVEQPRASGAQPRWSAAAGMRRQVGPRSAIDVGGGRRLGGDGEWFVTFGSAVSLGWPVRGGVR